MFEALQIPVLVDAGVNDVRSEDLLGFVRQKEHQIVHRVDAFVVVTIVSAELGEELFAKQLDGAGESLTEVFVLEGVMHAAFDLVDQGARHGHD